mmetsp:Transcript_28059/g.87381  ORF Transcript_28059/g.87381 Transcript_28059/m.87381 type:complete len:228 (-) Transcript_28059:129-812(-)
MAATDILMAPEVRSRHPTAFTPILNMLLGGAIPNLGNAYTGVPRNQLAANAPDITSAGWSSYAYRAALRAQDAERAARHAMARATRHEQIALACTAQARAALLEAEQMPRAASVQKAALRPFMRFCKQVGAYLDANPAKSRDSSVQRLRRFCGGLDAHLDRVLRNGWTVASDIGLRFGDVPPREYPKKPIWPSAEPTFHYPPMEGAPQGLPKRAGSGKARRGLLGFF